MYELGSILLLALCATDFPRKSKNSISSDFLFPDPSSRKVPAPLFLPSNFYEVCSFVSAGKGIVCGGFASFNLVSLRGVWVRTCHCLMHWLVY